MSFSLQVSSLHCRLSDLLQRPSRDGVYQMFAGPSRAHVTDWWKADFFALVRRRRFRLNPDCPLCLHVKQGRGVGWRVRVGVCGWVRGKKKKRTQSAVSVLTWAADLIWALGGADVSPVVADYKQTSLKWLHKSTSLKRIRVKNFVLDVATWTFLVSECFTPPLYARVFCRISKRHVLTVVAATAAAVFHPNFLRFVYE